MCLKPRCSSRGLPRRRLQVDLGELRENGPRADFLSVLEQQESSAGTLLLVARLRPVLEPKMAWTLMEWDTVTEDGAARAPQGGEKEVPRTSIAPPMLVLSQWGVTCEAVFKYLGCG